MLRNPATAGTTLIRRGFASRPKSTSSSSTSPLSLQTQRQTIAMPTTVMRVTAFNKTTSLIQRKQLLQQRMYKFSTKSSPTPPPPAKPRTNVLPWSIVTNPKVMNALPYIGHGAYMARLVTPENRQFLDSVVTGWTWIGALRSF